MTTASPRPVAAPVHGGASADRMLETVRDLASDRYQGRRVGTPGGRMAAQWLASQLAELGATVQLDSFEVTGVKELTSTPVAIIGQRRLTHRRDFAEQLSSAQVDVPRPAQLVPADADTWRDGWVIVAAADQQALARASAEDVAGLLVPRGVDEAGWMPKMIAGPPTGQVAIVSVRADLHADLAHHLSETLTASVPMRTITTTGTNVYGVFAEPSPGHPSVLLTAHFDGVGDDPNQRFPAAADNASGVAVALEAARLLSATLPNNVGLAVALLDGEEAGARGSAHHAPQLAPGTFVINVDGAARLGDAAAVEAGGPAELLLAALDQAGRHTGVPLRAGAMASDNRRYAAAGLPAIGIGMGMPGYQTPAETPDRVEATTLLAAADLVVATVHALCPRQVQGSD
ncbi:M28 family metallopeptidase [Kribbella sp. NBC_01245]|uniref:M28 family metallopeptidase n=1 Tax=Kribbella sp. NBC_01245 TaxID=2903578 RepID=UPI002E2C7186|nr:M28 family peptidase [Kribbella sp. NBC_01245]